MTNSSDGNIYNYCPFLPIFTFSISVEIWTIKTKWTRRRRRRNENKSFERATADREIALAAHKQSHRLSTQRNDVKLNRTTMKEKNPKLKLQRKQMLKYHLRKYNNIIKCIPFLYCFCMQVIYFINSFQMYVNPYRNWFVCVFFSRRHLITSIWLKEKKNLKKRK